MSIPVGALYPPDPYVMPRGYGGGAAYMNDAEIAALGNGIIMDNAGPVAGGIVDKANDGKFSVGEATKNFFKGIFSPITSMFSSVKNFAIGAAMIAGGIALTVATGGAALPFLIAAGVALGGFQVAKGGYKLLTARNGDEAERAFYDVGAGTAAIGLSALGAKASLRTAGLATAAETSQMSTYQAMAANFRAAPASFRTSWGMVRSGEAARNLSVAYGAFRARHGWGQQHGQGRHYGETKIEVVEIRTNRVVPMRQRIAGPRRLGLPAPEGKTVAVTNRPVNPRPSSGPRRYATADVDPVTEATIYSVMDDANSTTGLADDTWHWVNHVDDADDATTFASVLDNADDSWNWANHVDDVDLSLIHI